MQKISLSTPTTSQFSLVTPAVTLNSVLHEMAAAAAVFLLLILAATATPYASASWCVCKDGLSTAVLQKTLDYACGAGADCNPIHTSGACFNPNTVQSHCSYAVNSYYQKKGSSGATCDFSGTANIVSTDPSVGSGCTFPASSSAAGTSPTTNVPSSTTPSTRTPTTILPYSTTPTNGGGLGGYNTGLGPSGTNTNTDFSKAALLPCKTITLAFLVFFSGLVLLPSG